MKASFIVSLEELGGVIGKDLEGIKISDLKDDINKVIVTCLRGPYELGALDFDKTKVKLDKDRKVEITLEGEDPTGESTFNMVFRKSKEALAPFSSPHKEEGLF